MCLLAEASRLNGTGPSAYHWLFLAPSDHLSIVDLVRWLQVPAAPSQQRRQPTLRTPEGARKLIYRQLKLEGMAPEKREGVVKELIPSLAGTSEKVTDRFLGNCDHEYDHSLLTIVGRRGLHEHDILRFLMAPGDATDETLATKVRAKAFLDACESVRACMNSSLPVPPVGQNWILLIDDHPEQVEQTFHGLSSVLKGYDVMVWAPNEIDGLTLEDLSRYNSAHTADCHNKTILITPLQAGGKPDQKSVRDVLEKTRYVLVDQLFQRDDGKHLFLGPEVVRGLSRLSADLIRPSTDGPTRPDVVALSRTGSPEIIQRCLGAGARDYVLKSELYRLPAVLAGIGSANEEPLPEVPGAFHRLHHLPSHTRRLLKTVVIPAGPFDDNAATPRYRRIYEILRAVPKTDLHIHVGTCMSPEFLIAASLVSLAESRHPPTDLAALVSVLHDCLGKKGSCTWPTTLPGVAGRKGAARVGKVSVKFKRGDSWIPTAQVKAGSNCQMRLKGSKRSRVSTRDYGRFSTPSSKFVIICPARRLTITFVTRSLIWTLFSFCCGSTRTLRPERSSTQTP